VGGAVAAVALTFLSNIIAGAPDTPGLVVYRWNIGIFAVMGGVFAPVLAWSMLRRVPLWRTVAEPAVAGVGSTILAALFAPSLFPVIVPAAIFLSAARLNRAFRQAALTPHASGDIRRR
jgi:hypothetical protein